MKNTCLPKTKIVAIPIAVVLVLLFSSCTSYRDGFIKIREGEESCSRDKFDSIQRKKLALKIESSEIVSVIGTIDASEQAISPELLNRLFENLQAHYRIDSAFHRLFQTATDDSVKALVRQQMVESATGYHLFFQHNKDIRRVVNRGDQAFHVGKKTLLRSQQFLWTPANRALFKQTLPEKQLRQSKCQFLCRKYTDRCNASVLGVFGVVSEVFGRSIARVHRDPEPEKNIARLMSYLQEWDIILQKSPDRMTDKFIPGYFGHAAIYMGDSLFVESIQDGVVASNPFRFAEGGSFLVIRLKNISEEKEKRIQQLVDGQLGKKYDFNFDVNSPDRLFCAELVYLVYDDVVWQTEKKAWVVTMSPDQIIQTTINNESFCFPLFFDEEKLIENPSPDFIQSLLKEKD